MTRTFNRDSAGRRYTLHVDGELASTADYVVVGDSIEFPHTVTQPKFRGNGYAAQLVAWAMDDVESSSKRRVVPQCWFVAEWFELHPERAGLLTR
jgi:predicted GNAT family acetyltransferase